MVLALSSEWTQMLLNSGIMQFLGKISYTMYLLHELIVVWAMRDTYNKFLENDVVPDLAIAYIFLIYTPILLAASWVLEILVDSPAKQFAQDLDI